MAIEKGSAIVLRRVYFRNTSLIVTFLSREYGLLSTIAKGCRQPKSPLYGRLDYFNQGELVFYRKRNNALHLVSQFDPEREPIALRENFCRYAVASLMADQLMGSCESDEPVPELFALLQLGLAYLEDGNSPLQGAIAFGLKLLSAHGLTPILDRCSHCGSPLRDGDIYLAHDGGGFLCSKHGNDQILEAPVTRALLYLQRSGISHAAGRLKLSVPVAKQALRATQALLMEQLGVRQNTLAYLLRTANGEEGKHVA